MQWIRRANRFAALPIALALTAGPVWPGAPDARVSPSEQSTLQSAQPTDKAWVAALDELDRAREEMARMRQIALLVVGLALLALAGGGWWLARRARVAHKLALQAHALADARAEAQRAKSSFLANVGHEFHAPLSAMMEIAHALETDPTLPVKLREDMRSLQGNGARLRRLIDGVLDMSRVEAGQETLDEQDCAVWELCNQLSTMFQPAATSKGIGWRVQRDAQVPALVRTDGVKLRQVLVQLVGNAIKFTTGGKVVLRVTVAALNASSRRCTLRFEVADSGAGIPPRELAALGGAFVKGEAGNATNEGIGLGLALSRSHVQLLGGELAIRSAVGEGTTAQFEIPVQVVGAPQSDATPAMTGRRAVTIAGEPSSWRVLIADDESRARGTLADMLAPLGFELREAVNGQEAIDLAARWKPHLVLMDLRLPVVDSGSAMQRIKAGASGAVEPAVIAMAGTGSGAKLDDLVEAGYDGLLGKPLVEEALLETVATQLGVSYVYDDAGGAQSLGLMGSLPGVSLGPAHRLQAPTATQAQPIGDVPSIDRT